MHVLDAVDIDLDFVTDLQLGLLARCGEFAQGNAALGLQPDVDDGHVVFDGGNGAVHHATLETVGAAEHLIEHRGEIVAGGEGLGSHKVRYS